MTDLIGETARRGVYIDSLLRCSENAERSLSELYAHTRKPEGSEALGGLGFLLKEIRRMASKLSELEKKGTALRLHATIQGIRDSAEQRRDYQLADELDRVMGVE
tara:strand:+ start:347 stop:661 length:315 start_codon:yes stop_codon:yes gene_type:complete